jgi:hypothetical protein
MAAVLAAMTAGHLTERDARRRIDAYCARRPVFAAARHGAQYRYRVIACDYITGVIVASWRCHTAHEAAAWRASFERGFGDRRVYVITRDYIGGRAAASY